MNSYHDYNIYKYEVDSSNQRIKMFLKEHHGSDQQIIAFSGVVGHLFEHTLGGNIVLDLGVVDHKWFYTRSKEVLKRYHQYGLPLDVDSEDAFLQSMNRMNLKCYYLSTSYGMSGWILADSLDELSITSS